MLLEIDRLPKVKPTDEGLAAVDLARLSDQCALLACARLERRDRRGYSRAVTRALEFREEWGKRMATISSREEYMWGARK